MRDRTSRADGRGPSTSRQFLRPYMASGHQGVCIRFCSSSHGMDTTYSVMDMTSQASENNFSV